MGKTSITKLADNYIKGDDRQRRDILIKVDKKYHSQIDKFCKLIDIPLRIFENNLSRAYYIRNEVEKRQDIRNIFYDTVHKDVYYKEHGRIKKK
jgi:hypothetical protein